MGNTGGKVRVCYMPQANDSYGQSVKCIRDDLIKSLGSRAKACKCEKKKKTGHIVVVVQSQGRLGDEITSIITEEFRGDHGLQKRQTMVAVIQDDEHHVTDSSVMANAFPELSGRISSVDVHVVPLKKELHKCPSKSNRNKEATHKIKKWAKKSGSKVIPLEEGQ